jgi:hypothetical protein
MSKYTVMIWSSARPKNVNRIVEKLFLKNQRRKLVAVWSRDNLDLSTKDYLEKTQVYKRLQKVWDDDLIQSKYPAIQGYLGGHGVKYQTQTWDQKNTVLIDDSRLKAAAEPYNLIEIPEFADKNENDHTILDNVRTVLETLSYQADVSQYLRAEREGAGMAGGANDKLMVKQNESESGLSDSDVDDEDGGVVLEPQGEETTG